MTNSRSCEAVNGFHDVTFDPGGKAIRYSWFQPLKAFSAFGSFSPVSRPFFKRAREPEGKLRHVVYAV